MAPIRLPCDLQEALQRFADAIKARLAEFQAPKDERDIFYEFCYCTCTPQTKARHALIAVETLRWRSFYEDPFDPAPILADRAHYVRFHRTKAARLLQIHAMFDRILDAMQRAHNPFELRRWIVQTVPGFGWKEASHVLRNLGHFELAIIDRHILRQLHQLHVIAGIDLPRNETEYEMIENAFCNFAIQVDLELQVLDLLLWAAQTGEVLK